MQYGLCNCLYMYCCWRFNYQKGVVIPLSGLSQPYVRACLKPGHVLLLANVILFYEEFEGTKGVIRIRISKKNRQENGQKKNVQKDKQRSTKHIYKTTDRVTRIPLNTGGELMCSGRVSSSCSTSDTRRVNLVTNPVISRK